MNQLKHVIRATAMAAVLLAGSATAQASWIQIVDPDGTDTATNPGSGAGGPSNQNAGTIAAWLQDLVNAPAAPALLAQNDEFNSASIGGLPSAGNLYLTLHYGNFAGANNVTVAFSCVSGCGPTFTGYQTQGLSNYRLYGTASSVPEPVTLGLLGLGLLGVAAKRRRK